MPNISFANRKNGLLASAVAVACVTFAPGADARITRIDLGSPTSPFGSTGFGSVGQYEQIDGTAYGEIDPRDPLNAVIQDIELAPRNSRGKVEYSTKVSILKPVDESHGNHTLLFEILNRGNKLDPGTFNVGVTTANPAGDGFLENQGFTLVWAGWQADLVPPAGVNLVTMSAPIAHQRNGATITGVVRSEFIVNTTPQSTQNILAASSPNTPGYPTVSLDSRKNPFRSGPWRRRGCRRAQSLSPDATCRCRFRRSARHCAVRPERRRSPDRGSSPH
jgi:hypothetical protein